MREMSDAEGVSEGARDDLNHAGAVVDQAIGYMLKQDLSGVAIASALLGGAMSMLTRSLDAESVLRILDQAATSVRAGEFDAPDAG
jgi:hypothetical protein